MTTNATTGAATAAIAAVRILPLDPGATVEVFLASGSVRVHGTNDARLVVRSRDGRALDEAVEVEASRSRVRIRDAAGEFRLGADPAAVAPVRGPRPGGSARHHARRPVPER